jgi:hypothetical protein
LVVLSRPESAHRRTVSSLTPSSSAACLIRYDVPDAPGDPDDMTGL